MIERLLVPVDGSETALRAAELGGAFARQFDATMEIVHVIGDRTLRLGEQHAVDPTTRGEDVLDTARERVTPDGIEPTTSILDGRPPSTIAAYAEEQGFDMIVMGRHGRSGVRERLIGTVTDRVLRTSTVPVLTVPGGDESTSAEAGIDTILLPTDGSEQAEQAAPYGGNIAANFGASLHLLTVVDVDAAAGVFDAGGVPASFIDELEADGQAALDRLETAVGDGAGEVHSTLRRGTPHQEIGTVVTDQEVDLIVMASTGQSNVVSQSLGSTAARVLRTVSVPVLVIT